MDKKNTFIGALLFAAAFLVLIYTQRYSPQRPQPAEIRREVKQEMAAQPASPSAIVRADEPTFTTARAESTGANITRLSNGFVQVNFTDFGGAIRDVAFRKYPIAVGSEEPFVFNSLHSDPILAFVGAPGLDKGTRYQLVSKTDTEVVFQAVLDQRLEVTRRYRLSPDKSPATDPYIIRTETTFRNLTDKELAPMHAAFSIGTAAPNNAIDNGLQLSTEFWNGKDQTLVRRASLESSGGFPLFGWGAHGPRAVVTGEGPIAWATVKNQFFASILTPDEPAAGLETRRVKLLDALPDSDTKAYGITGAVDVDVRALPARGQASFNGDIYVGPKEYVRLANSDVFRKDQDRVMDFGNFIFRFCAAILLTLMTWIHSWAVNWGISIILTTLALKFAFLPLTVSQSRSSRRMQKIQPEMKGIREKYKDNPQKQQQATMELFKKHKVNPLGGCLPMLLTIPFFFAFFRMLQSAAEIRFASFLWIHDLSGPDTVLAINSQLFGSFNLNILPFVLCAVAFFQMRVTPQPSVDNAQMKMMKFMPLMFLFFYYTWPAALSLYSTVNGLFTIGQQLVVNQIPDPDPDEAAFEAKSGKGRPTKNVTPKKG